jgi:hypothetical protein
MPACPWCQAPVTDLRFPCRSCGRRPKDHVSQAAAAAPHAAPQRQAEPEELELLGAPAGEEDIPLLEPLPEDQDIPLLEPPPPEAPAFEVPDLALPTPPPKRGAPAAAAARPQPVQSAPVAASGGKVPSFAPPPVAQAKKKAPAPAGVSAFDDGMEMMGADHGSIELGTGHTSGAMGPPESLRSEGPKSELPEWARVSAVGAPAPAPGAPRVAPVSSVMMSEDGGRGVALRLADYGEAPAEWWKAPFYAYRVKMRQMELRRELAARRVDLEAAQAAVDDALVVLAERVRPELMHKEAYAKLLGPVISAENALRERDGELAAATEAHKRQTSGLDQRIAQHERELAVERAEEKALSDAFDRADAIRQRAEAKIKRIDIDLRAAVARANAGASVPGLKAADVSQSDPEVVARTAERQARVAELEQAMPAVTAASQPLTVQRKKVTAIEAKMLAVKNERAGLEAQFKKRGAAYGAEVAKAQKEVRIATAALGRAVALDEATFGAAWTEARAEIATLDKAVAARDDDVMLHVMALDVHDAKKVSTGITLVAAALVAFVCLLALPVVVRAVSRPPPPPPAAVE